MPASTGKTGRGGQFEIDLVASPVAWVGITNVRSISFTGRQADEIDFTHLLSEGAYREFRQGFKDAGTITLDGHFDAEATSHVGTNGILGLFNSGTVFNWRINLGELFGFGLTGQGYFQNPGDITVDVDNPVGFQPVVRVTGESTLVEIA
jgi:hypothetical protein